MKGRVSLGDQNMKGRVSLGDQNADQTVILIRKYLKEIVCEDMKCNLSIQFRKRFS